MEAWIIGIVIGFIIGFFISYKMYSTQLSTEEGNRKRLSGKYTEKFVPFLKNFKYNPSDCYFLGMPIDFIVFDGLSDGEIKSVTFLEVKTSKSILTNRQKMIKEAILNNRIYFDEERLCQST